MIMHRVENKLHASDKYRLNKSPQTSKCNLPRRIPKRAAREARRVEFRSRRKEARRVAFRAVLQAIQFGRDDAAEIVWIVRVRRVRRRGERSRATEDGTANRAVKVSERPTKRFRRASWLKAQQVSGCCRSSQERRSCARRAAQASWRRCKARNSSTR